MTSRNFSMVSYAYTACWDATLKQAQGKSLLRPDLGGAFYTGRRSRDELYFQCRPPLDSVLSTKKVQTGYSLLPRKPQHTVALRIGQEV
ncbi:hypothetical protein OUZ56_013478 [Daphnia magna]|uniref:Uncharacterized protein n=1 Tax=Daphnia magna TaxID=35525 RepID=A0ABQ9Z636_9CRUS|nr:hypothetical protein OUZ56_013478 [Daphnia magna]